MAAENWQSRSASLLYLLTWAFRTCMSLAASRQITASTNKVEAYHRFAKWLFFGGEGLLLAIHPDEQEKRLKYNHLLTNAVAIQNVIDLTRAVRGLLAEGYPVKHEDLATLSPYQTRHIKRFGDYVFTVTSPEPFDGELTTLTPNDASPVQVATA